MAKAKYRVIYNPYSGSNTGLSTAEKVKDFIKDDEFKFEDMTKIADYKAFFSTFEEGENLLICGGDGTLNHFINDLGDDEIPVEVYYFATGTGNDFLNDLEKKPEDGIVNITKYLKNLPEVEVNGKTYKFINGVGYGIDGYCCEVGDKQRAQGKTEIKYLNRN